MRIGSDSYENSSQSSCRISRGLTRSLRSLYVAQSGQDSQGRAEEYQHEPDQSMGKLGSLYIFLSIVILMSEGRESDGGSMNKREEGESGVDT